jgi:hypothetical protein
MFTIFTMFTTFPWRSRTTSVLIVSIAMLGLAWKHWSNSGWVRFTRKLSDSPISKTQIYFRWPPTLLYFVSWICVRVIEKVWRVRTDGHKDDWTMASVSLNNQSAWLPSTYASEQHCSSPFMLFNTDGPWKPQGSKSKQWDRQVLNEHGKVWRRETFSFFGRFVVISDKSGG